MKKPGQKRTRRLFNSSLGLWWKQVLTNVRKDTKVVVLLRVVLLLVLTISCGLWSFKSLEKLRYENEQQDVKEIKGETNAVEKNTADAILKQSEQFQSWAVLILTGIIALLITTKVHRTPSAPWAYLPLGPAAVFLVMALNAGWVLMKRYTFLSSLNNFSDFSGLANLAQMQSYFFLYAMLCMGLFAGWFLFLIMFGKIETSETK